MKKRNPFSLVIYLGILGLFLWLIFTMFSGFGNELAYSEVVELFEQEQVRAFTVSKGNIYLQLHTPYDGKTSITTGLANPEQFRAEMWDLIQRQHDAGILESYDFVAQKQPTYYSLILPLLIVGLVLLILWAILAGKVNANNPMNNFGRARTVLGIPDGKKVTFDDVAGADEEKQELQEVVDFLRDPAKYTAIGARIPPWYAAGGPSRHR